MHTAIMELDLVSFQVDQIFVPADRVARVPVPACDDRVLHGFGQYGYFYFNRHLKLLARSLSDLTDRSEGKPI
jgi:hypothetical protein